MEVFVYNAAKERETVDEFNSRVARFCLDNAIINVNAQCCGPQLVISVALADDLEVDVPQPTLMPWTMPINASDQTLEESLTSAKDSLASLHRDDDTRIPAEVHLKMREDRPDQGYAVFVIVTGSVGFEE